MKEVGRQLAGSGFHTAPEDYDSGLRPPAVVGRKFDVLRGSWYHRTGG